MSAAATAAGYLYASGRLRGRAQREQQENEHGGPQKPAPEAPKPRVERPKVAAVRKETRVAAIPPREDKPRRTPTIQYRTRRWKPSE
jgi:hypothetical protein